MTRLDWEKARSRELGLASFRERPSVPRCPVCGAALRGITRLHGRSIYEEYGGALRPCTVWMCPYGDGAEREVWLVETDDLKIAFAKPLPERTE